jgi:Cu+-exporting ATPase
MKQKYSIQGMTCAACQLSVQKSVATLNGVKDVQVNLLTHAMTVDFDESLLKSQHIVREVKEAGYGAKLWEDQTQTQIKFKQLEASSMRRRMLLSILCLVPLMYVAMGPMLTLPLPSLLGFGLWNLLIQIGLTIPIIVLNHRYFTVGMKRLFKLDPNMDSLVAIGTGAALIYSFINFFIFLIAYVQDDMMGMMALMNHFYFESVATILALVTVGKYIEEVSKSKTLGALNKLLDLKPKMAIKLTKEGWKECLVQDIQLFDRVQIKPGTLIPVDGKIVNGTTQVNQAAITGESMPVDKFEGDVVIGATLNLHGVIEVEVTRIGEDTTISKLIKLVEEASQSKAPLAKLADKISGIFVPIVMIISFGAFIFWLIITRDLGFSLQIMVAILVISCPCALGLATPVTMMVGTGIGASHGILIKSAEAMEKLNKISVVVFDKTGTITKGKPIVESMITIEGNRLELLQIAGSIEQKSEHPLGKAIVELMEHENLMLKKVDNFVYAPGFGVRGVVENRTYRLGKVLKEESVDPRVLSYQSLGYTTIKMTSEDRVLAYFVLTDEVKPSASMAIASLKGMHLKTYMLTGDATIVAETLASKVGIEHVLADMLPEDKDGFIQQLQKEGKNVLMVGDGVNDAPSLVRADVGMAIGVGTDIAIEAADVVLISHDLTTVATALHLSKKVVRNMKTNLFWAFIYNLIAIPIAAGLLYGYGILLNPMIAALAMAFSSVSVVLNALRLRSFKIKKGDESWHKFKY